MVPLLNIKPRILNAPQTNGVHSYTTKPLSGLLLFQIFNLLLFLQRGNVILVAEFVGLLSKVFH